MRDSVRALNRPCWLPGTASRQDDRSFTWSGCVAVAVLAGVPAAGWRGRGAAWPRRRCGTRGERPEGEAAGGEPGGVRLWLRLAGRSGPDGPGRGRGWPGQGSAGADVPGGGAGGGGLGCVLLGVAEHGDGFGERGQPDDEQERGECPVLGEPGPGGDQPGGVAELVRSEEHT